MRSLFLQSIPLVGSVRLHCGNIGERNRMAPTVRKVPPGHRGDFRKIVRRLQLADDTTVRNRRRPEHRS